MVNPKEHVSGDQAPDNTFKTKIIKTKIAIDNDIFDSYGIVIIHQDGTEDKYDDITFSEDKINKLYDLFAENDIDKMHIEDIISDFINELHSI